jgi:hypothetical protein
MRYNISIFKTLCFSVAFALIYRAVPAYAVQQHGGLEGLVSHQVGHILFISGMGYLLYRVYHSRISGAGWFEFKGFLWLIILWNILTFSGHWMREIVNPDRFIRQGAHVTSFIITDTFDTFFYLTRLDHLLLVPSFVFLLLALQKWRRLQ